MRMIDENYCNFEIRLKLSPSFAGTEGRSGAEQCDDASRDISACQGIIVEGLLSTNVVNYFIFDAGGRGKSEAE